MDISNAERKAIFTEVSYGNTAFFRNIIFSLICIKSSIQVEYLPKNKVAMLFAIQIEKKLYIFLISQKMILQFNFSPSIIRRFPI